MRNRISDLIWFGVEEGKETSCMVPLEGVNGITVEARCSKDCALNVVTDSGEIMPLDHGRIVRWSGPTTGYSAVEIVADTGFWYAVQKSSKWYEIPDPTPMAIELTQTKEDIIKSLIDERLRAYTVRMKMEKNLTEDEKDELILDIAHGDLEFDEGPDQFGLGYEERLAEFTAEQAIPEPPEAVPVPAPPAGNAPPKPAAGSDSSST